MRVLRELGDGFLYALVSVVLVLGGLSLSLAENYNPQRAAPTQNFLTLPPPASASAQSAAPGEITQAPTATPAPPKDCPPPAGWILLPVQPGETLEGLAQRHNTTAQQLAQANCLLTQNLVAGYNIYLPASATTTPLPCGPFPGWIAYTIQPGDTLYHIATLYGTSVANLQQANCLGNSQYIRSGSRLWVPNVPTITPGVTIIPDFSTPSETPTLPLTSTDLPFTGTPLPFTGTPSQ